MDGALRMSGASASSSSPPQLPTVPELRQDLTLEPGAPGVGGERTWLIVDAAQHRYVQIDEMAYQLLSCWQAGSTYAVFASEASRRFHHVVSEDDVASFVRFAADSNLTVEPLDGGWKHYAAAAGKAEHGWLMWMVHNYLFIKLPLVRPEPMLRRLVPWVSPLYSRSAALVVAAIGLAGLFLVSRHWSEFWGTFQHTFSLQGAAAFGIALIIVKSAHELGHAFTAVRFGCRVPSMGVCFMVLMPVLYTDVTDAWRLQDRRQRLMIGGAGIVVELALALIATFLWVFLPEGIAKSLMFSIATTGWIMSLMINLNPLMRFDGYYLFSDWIGVDNLQSRSFAFGRWQLKELLFAPRLPAPERLPARTAKTLIAYAWLIWVYRLVLFTGIAVLVYHMAFKVLGIILFLVEIIYFVAWPIASEVAGWWAERKTLGITRRAMLTGILGAVAVLVSVIPWSTAVSLPAVLEASELSRVFPQRAGIVEKVLVKAGDRVAVGAVMAVMRSDDSAHRLAVVKKKIMLTKMRLARRSSDVQDRAQSMVLESQLQSLFSERDGLNKELAELIIVAPHAGTVVEFNGEVHPGRSISRSEQVALVRGDGPLSVRGYLAEESVWRLPQAAKGSFIADLPGARRISVQLSEVASSGATSIETPELVSLYGGSIAVRPHSGSRNDRRMIPVSAQYLTTMTADIGTPPPHYAVRGTVELSGEAQSFIGRAWRQVAAVLVRESGF
jgi:putative peptide zinc metalloprotease protein